MSQTEEMFRSYVGKLVHFMVGTFEHSHTDQGVLLCYDPPWLTIRTENGTVHYGQAFVVWFSCIGRSDPTLQEDEISEPQQGGYPPPG